jgi:hypothetical protein
MTTLLCSKTDWARTIRAPLPLYPYRLLPFYLCGLQSFYSYGLRISRRTERSNQA